MKKSERVNDLLKRNASVTPDLLITLCQLVQQYPQHELELRRIMSKPFPYTGVNEIVSVPFALSEDVVKILRATGNMKVANFFADGRDPFAVIIYAPGYI